jgi:hypothetical protein
MARSFKILLVALVVVAVAATVYALAAANTVPGTRAGSGSGTISGYTISNVTYTLNGTDPTTLDSVSFDLSASATTVRVKLVASGSAWYSCTHDLVVLTHWTCDTTADHPAIDTLDQLSVVAAE